MDTLDRYQRPTEYDTIKMSPYFPSCSLIAKESSDFEKRWECFTVPRISITYRKSNVYVTRPALVSGKEFFDGTYEQ